MAAEMDDIARGWRTMVPDDDVTIDGVRGVVIKCLPNSKQPEGPGIGPMMRVLVKLVDGRRVVCEYIFGRPFQTVRVANPLDLLSEV